MNQRLDAKIISILDIAKDLLSIPGISGHEDTVGDYFIKQVGGYGTIIRDTIGNCLLKVDRVHNGPTILVTAHMDTIGFVVREIRDEKNAELLPIGINQLDQYHSTQAIAIGERKATKGLITTKNGSTPKFSTKRKEPTLYEAAVDAGDQVVVYNPMSLELNSEAKFISGSWLDNRMGLSVLINLIKEIPSDLQADVLLLSSVREEIGARGVEMILRKYSPDLAIVIDATWPQGPVRMGGGPVLTVWDPCVIVRPKDRRFITELASAKSIPLQKEVVEKGSSDAGPLARAGIPTFCIMYPVMDLHSPEERLSLQDIAWNLIFVESLINALSSCYWTS